MHRASEPPTYRFVVVCRQMPIKPRPACPVTSETYVTRVRGEHHIPVGAHSCAIHSRLKAAPTITLSEILGVNWRITDKQIIRFNFRDTPPCLPGYKRSLCNEGARGASHIPNKRYREKGRAKQIISNPVLACSGGTVRAELSKRNSSHLINHQIRQCFRIMSHICLF